MTTISVEFKTKVTQLKGKVTKEKLNVNPLDTWKNILNNEFDPNVYFLCSGTGKIQVSFHDRVMDYTGQFKRRRNHHILYIEKMEKVLNQLPSSVVPQNKINGRRKATDPPTSIPPIKIVKQQEIFNEINMNEDRVLENEQLNESDTTIELETALATARQLGCTEMDVIEDDMSQDSVDLGGDIKARVTQNIINGVGNGDLYRICNEINQLKQTNKFIRASRYLPFTLNILQHIFLD